MISALAIAIGVTYTPTEGNEFLSAILRYGVICISLFPIIINPSKHRANKNLVLVAIALSIYILILNLGNAIPSLFIMVWTLLLSCLFVSIWSEEESAKILATAIDGVIIIFSALLAFQAAYYSVTGSIVDLHSSIFPFSQARLFQANDSLWRLTGHQIEPGTYSNWMYALILLRALATNNLFSRTSLLGIVTILVTTSLWGLFSALAFALAYYFRKNTRAVVIRKILTISLVLIPSGLLIYLLGLNFVDYASMRLTLNDFSSLEKIAVFSSISQDWANYLFIGKPLNYDYCNGCFSRQDAGIIVNIFVHLGGLATIVLLGILALGAKRSLGYVGIIAITPLIFGKYSATDFPFWLVFYFCVHRLFSDKKQLGTANNEKNK